MPMFYLKKISNYLNQKKVEKQCSIFVTVIMNLKKNKMNKGKLKLGIVMIAIGLFMSCKSSQNNEPEAQKSSQTRENRGGQGQGKRPTVAQIFERMDANNDGVISKTEAKGPLKNDFSKVDTNSDGVLSKEEIEKAPKPEGRGPQGGGQRRQ